MMGKRNGKTKTERKSDGVCASLRVCVCVCVTKRGIFVSELSVCADRDVHTLLHATERLL